MACHVTPLLVVCYMVLACPLAVHSEGFFQWKSCDEQSRPVSKGIVVNQLSISPDPIVIPHNIEVEFEAEVIGNFTEPLNLDLDIWILVDMYWFTARVPIPGCCTFEDLCAMLVDDPPTFHCPVGAAENCIDCAECPPPPRSFNTSVTPLLVPVGDLPFFIKLFVSGKYEARATITDGVGDVVLCMELSLEATTSSTEAENLSPVLDTLPDYCSSTTNSSNGVVN